MKVLHVVPSVAARDGGPSAAVLQMCEAVARQGAEVLIACTDADGPASLSVPLDTPTEYRGATVLFFKRLWTESYKYSPALAAWLNRHVGDFDVVHIHAVMSHASIAAGRACRHAGVPYIVRPLGTLDRWSMEQKFVRKRLLMRLAGDRLLAGAAAVHCTAQEECDALAALGVGHGVVIPLGIDASLVADRGAPVPATPPYVLSLSRLHPVKALELLIEAFADATVDDRFRDWRLKIAGDGDHAYVASLHRLAAGSSAATRIEFLGWIDGPVKADLVAGASLFALTSHHENFGVALLEALARGVPAVVSRGVQLSSVIEQVGAGWVTPLSRETLTSVLRDALSNGAERGRRGIAARALASRWQWPLVADQLIELYQRVLTRSGSIASHPTIERAEARAK